MNSSSADRVVPLPVAVDAMGADYGSGVVVEGALHAVKELGISVIIVGREDELRKNLSSLGASTSELLQIRHAEEVITMSETPSKALRSKENASIRVAFELVRDGKACAVLSPGNTGAMMAAGLMISGNLPGIARPAIASLIPKVGDASPTVFLDSGANIDCHAYQLVQFALMGAFYAHAAIAKERPRIALLSNGTESTKGTDRIRSAALMLSEIPDLNFIGYIEGRDLPRDLADVVVCDGFVGNIVLKTMEGGVELVFDSIRHYVERSWRGKLGMWLAKPIFKLLFGEKLDPSAYGGAPLLGLNHIAIVCHGSAKQRAIMNGIRVARRLSDDGLVERLSQALSALEPRISGGYENGMWNRMEQRFSKGIGTKEKVNEAQANAGDKVEKES